jgi:hypothetical protein
MPPLQLAGIRQFMEGTLRFLFLYKKRQAKGKTVENNHHLKHSALSNGLYGRKIHQ